MKKNLLGLATILLLVSTLSAKVEEIKTVADYENLVTRSTSPVVIDFYADWCKPCKKMSPIFDKLSTEFEGKVRFVKINADTSAVESIIEQFNIRSIPTFIFKKGQSTSQRTGSMSEAELRTVIEGLLK